MDKEWEKEPDEVKFESNGFKCLIYRNFLGCLCGYVALTKKHPYYGKDYDEMKVDVHGGLTWAAIGEGQYGRDKGYYWIGFDCAHSGDYVPGMEQFHQKYHISSTNLFGAEDKYRNIEYVRNELIKLTEQLVPLNMAIKKLKGDE